MLVLQKAARLQSGLKASRCPEHNLAGWRTSEDTFRHVSHGAGAHAMGIISAFTDSTGRYVFVYRPSTLQVSSTSPPIHLQPKTCDCAKIIRVFVATGSVEQPPQSNSSSSNQHYPPSGNDNHNNNKHTSVFCCPPESCRSSAALPAFPSRLLVASPFCPNRETGFSCLARWRTTHGSRRREQLELQRKSTGTRWSSGSRCQYVRPRPLFPKSTMLCPSASLSF